MKYNEITVHTACAGIEVLSNELVAIGVGGFEVSDSKDFEEFLQTTTPHWDYVDDKLLYLKNAESVIRIYLPDNAQGNATKTEIFRAVADLRKRDTEHLYGSLDITETERDDSEWKDTWKQYYKPIIISDRLAIVPEWETYTPTDGQAVLWMDPGAAFGTGSHETTAMCLSFLSEASVAGKTVLDVGCGSGILGIAAVLLGADQSVGVDIDTLAVKAGKENAERNSVGQKCRFFAGDLVDKAEGQYDIICANIVADVIKTLLPDVGRFLKEDGFILLSGIIEERSEEIEQAIARNGFAVVGKKQNGGWTAYRCAKAKS